MNHHDWIRHLEAIGGTSPEALPPDRTLLAGERGEQRLWRACAGERVAIREVLGARAAEAIRWHLEHTQPDNSTNRPWALHAFLLADDGSGDASLYAETLLHNMRATDARTEPLSRWILADAARELRLAHEA